MRVNSNNSIFNLGMPKAGKVPSTSGEGGKALPQRNAPAGLTRMQPVRMNARFSI